MNNYISPARFRNQLSYLPKAYQLESSLHRCCHAIIYTCDHKQLGFDPVQYRLVLLDDIELQYVIYFDSILFISEDEAFMQLHYLFSFSWISFDRPYNHSSISYQSMLFHTCHFQLLDLILPMGFALVADVLHSSLGEHLALKVIFIKIFSAIITLHSILLVG